MIGAKLVSRYMHPTSIDDPRANSKDAVAICTVFVTDAHVMIKLDT
jgi:hypothetical protein